MHFPLITRVILLTVLTVFCLVLQHAADHDLALKSVDEFTGRIPSLDQLAQRFGRKPMSLSESRNLYNSIIASYKTWNNNISLAGADDEVVAIGCNLIRHRIKVYVRSRQASLAWTLRLRDAWAHGVVPFFAALMELLSDPRSFDRARVLAPLLDIPFCLMQHPDYPCPSIMSLAARKRGDYQAIAGRCFHTNEAWTRAATSFSDSDEDA